MKLMTGIFGGSFNPIHCGHVALAEAILRHAPVDEVWLMVSPQNPLKQQADLLDDQLRLQLACKALEGHDRISASDYEMHLPRPSYTWHLLQSLDRHYADRQFTLIIGGDNWQHFDRWHHADDIARRYPIIVYPRQGCDKAPQAAAHALSVEMLSETLLPVSSTDIRRRVAQGDSIRGLVPEAIRHDVEQLYHSPQTPSLT